MAAASELLKPAVVTSTIQTMHTVQPQPPFNFLQALAFLSRFPPTLGERAIAKGAALGAARLHGKTIGFRVWAEGDANAPVLNCQLHTEEPLTDQTARAVVDRIGAWLGVADDLRPFYALAAADPPFMRVVHQLYGYHQVRFFTPFENTCWAILGQRTPMSLAQAAKRGLMTRYAGSQPSTGSRSWPSQSRPTSQPPR